MTDLEGGQKMEATERGYPVADLRTAILATLLAGLVGVPIGIVLALVAGADVDVGWVALSFALGALLGGSGIWWEYFTGHDPTTGERTHEPGCALAVVAIALGSGLLRLLLGP